MYFLLCTTSWSCELCWITSLLYENTCWTYYLISILYQLVLLQWQARGSSAELNVLTCSDPTTEILQLFKSGWWQIQLELVNTDGRFWEFFFNYKSNITDTWLSEKSSHPSEQLLCWPRFLKHHILFWTTLLSS